MINYYFDFIKIASLNVVWFPVTVVTSATMIWDLIILSYPGYRVQAYRPMES